MLQRHLTTGHEILMPSSSMFELRQVTVTASDKKGGNP